MHDVKEFIEYEYNGMGTEKFSFTKEEISILLKELEESIYEHKHNLYDIIDEYNEIVELPHEVLAKTFSLSKNSIPRVDLKNRGHVYAESKYECSKCFKPKKISYYKMDCIEDYFGDHAKTKNIMHNMLFKHINQYFRINTQGFDSDIIIDLISEVTKKKIRPVYSEEFVNFVQYDMPMSRGRFKDEHVFAIMTGLAVAILTVLLVFGL